MHEPAAAAWEEVKVVDVIERHFCGPSPDCEERPVFDDAEWGVLKTTAITWSGWNQDAHKVLPRSYWGQDSIEVKAGDVLVTKAGPRHRVAVATHVPATRPHLVVSGKMIGLRPRTELVLPEVLAGLLALSESQKYINDRATGMAESQVNFANGVLLDTPLHLPPKAEQTKIARIASVLDTAIRQTEAIIEKLKQVKQGLLHDLLTRGIDANGELRPPQSQAPHLYKDSPLGWIPREWDTVPVSDLAENLDGQRLPIKEADRRPGGYPYYGASGIIDWVESYIFDGDYVLLGEDGENVVSRNLPLAFRVSGKIWVNNHAHVYEPRRGVDIRFLTEVLEAKDYGPWVSGSAQPKLTQDALARIRFQRPAGHEQVLIADRLEALVSRIASENSEVLKLRSLKSGLMDDLLTGRVRVTPLLEASTASV